MREGKIYAIEKAEQALANFFKQGNLIALRELALREVADHIDDRLEAHDDRSALRGPWRRMEIIYVCVNAKPKAEFLIRRGFRTAHRMKAKLLVSFVQDAMTLSAEEATCIESLKGLTRRLGGELFICMHRRRATS
jgi:two-component system sensor histidine kinase KdpD